MTERDYNFAAGPAVLPVPVLEQIQREILALPGVGASILEISHRSKPFIAILEAAKTNLRKLLSIGDDYDILFLQGGGRLMFSAVPMNLAAEGQSCDFIVTGSWGKYALKEAQHLGRARVAWDGKDGNYTSLPQPGELKLDPEAAFVHLTSNETIEGVQFPQEPEVGDVPLVCDASSDFLHKPLEISKYGLIYACAQKNAGPAGVTIVVIRKDLLARSSDKLPGYLNLKLHAENESLWNTAPTFPIYVVKLVTDWLLNECGGLAAMYKVNQQKAKILYEVLDKHPDFYRGHARHDCRSLINVTFRLPSEELTEQFVSAAKKQGLAELKGHRSVGGIRASIYNAMPIAGVERLREFMLDFAKPNAS
jgi:phosphoserine aminotransferase